MRRFKPLFTFGRVLWALTVGIFLNLAYIGYMRFYPFKTVTVKTSTFQVVNKPVQAGGVLAYRVEYCRYTDVSAHSSRTLIGPTIITISETDTSTDVGCHTSVITNTIIPSYAPPGVYYLKIDTCYAVNPLRNICHHFKTDEFFVTTPDE